MTTAHATTPQSISLGDAPVNPDKVLTLQGEFYKITPQQSEFFKQQTGITDDDELKRHILSVQAEAYKVAPYPGIMGFSFISLLLKRLPAGEDVINIGLTRKDAIFLDIGCSVGTDVRKAAADGFPADRTIGSDIHPEFGDLAHKLFRTTPETFPGHFIPGDAFDPEMLSVVQPFETVPDSPEPDLKTLTSLNPLHGRISAIHASNFFHLFGESTQLHLARALAGLLSPVPGSIICGGNRALPEKGRTTESLIGTSMFCHCPQTWAEMWDGVVFPKGSVEVEAHLVEMDMLGHKNWYMMWSVKRL
ncbi:hypothetical protein PAXRUDRAFT_835266 [Paxillus rubicundulus Ve08.2h10]|uniref:Unplaced genomic scaffold scaffold_2529, whole genome shotgun sequence n=1 Tax=Paxillus rubicundulus Ve08.2h10 TaxID=930991 RepID=A0A0D0C041_9AGAM|nr:hypothetical protein PAXRUDRAFT_835266 [Paxillus rubicundulus Ve08.2h10]